MWAGIGLLRRSVIGGIAILCLVLSLLIVVNPGGSTGAEASLKTDSGVATSNNKSSNSPNSETSASDGGSGLSDDQIQSNSGSSESVTPNGAAAGSPSGAVPGQSSNGQQQSTPGSPGTFPTTTRPSGTTSPPQTSPPTTIACPTNSPNASGYVTSAWQPPYNPNVPSSSQEYYASGSVVVTNTGNRTVNVSLTGYLWSGLDGSGFNLGSFTVGANSSSTLGFSDVFIFADSIGEIETSVTIQSFNFQC
jgi:hypothetical protein